MASEKATHTSICFYSPEKLFYLFAEPALPEREEFFPKKADAAATAHLLGRAATVIGDLANAASDEEAENLIKAFAEEEGLKLGDLMMPLRVAITGARISPPLFGSLRLLGTAKCLARINRALAVLR